MSQKRFVSKKLMKISKEELEKIGRRFCYILGIKPNYYDSWKQASTIIDQNLVSLFGIDNG